MSNNSSVVDVNDGSNYILLLRLIGWGYIGIVISLFGIIGNIITILVLISPSMRTTSTNIYLTALSCSNILFLLIFIPSYSMRYLLGYKLFLTNQPPFAFEVLLLRLPTTPIYNTLSLSIIYLTIALSLDRLILVKFPLKAKQTLTLRTTFSAISFIYLFCIIYCIPYWLEQHYRPDIKQCRLTSIGIKLYKYTRIYIYIPVVYLFPFVTLTCINITIIQDLIAGKRRKESLGAKSTKKKQADHHITLMLVAVIIVFVLCQLPLLILNIWHAIDPTKEHGIFFHILNSVGVLLIVFNTSTNFLLYCFFGQKFRQTLVKFIFNIITDQNQQSLLQARITKLAEKQATLPALLIQQKQSGQRISSGNSSSTANDLNMTKTKPMEIDKPISTNISDQKSSMNTMETQEESCPLINTSEQIFVINENFQFKQDHNLNLYTCANGKRVLVLKI